MGHRRREILVLAAILALGLGVRLLLLPSPALRVDILFYGRWAAALLQGPLGDFYARGAPDCDYLPGYLYILAATARLTRLAHVSLSDPAALAPWIKLAPVAADLVLGLAVFQLARRHVSPARSLAATMLVVLNPALMMLSAVWGQVDSVGAALSMAALLALASGNPVLAAIWAGAGFAVKPQYPLFLIMAGVAYLRTETRRLPYPGSAAARATWIRWTGRKVALPLVALVTTIQLLLLPFSVSLLPLPGVTWTLSDRLAFAANWDRVTSVNALNLWATPIAGLRVPDSTLGWFSLSYQTWGFLLLALLLMPGLLLAWRRAGDPGTVLLACVVAAYAVFEVPTRMHERYLFMAIPLAAAAVAFKPWTIRIYSATTFVYLINLLWNYFAPDQARVVGPAATATFVSVASTLGVLPLVVSVGILVGMVVGRGEDALRREQG